MEQTTCGADYLVDDGNWVSDYEILGDLQSAPSLDRPTALEQMVAQVPTGSAPAYLFQGIWWKASRDGQARRRKLAAHFSTRAEAFDSLSRLGQICWFDTDPRTTGDRATC